MQRSDLDLDKRFLEYETVGFLLEETDYSYVVAQSIGREPDKQDCIGAVLEIPKCAVSRVVMLDV